MSSFRDDGALALDWVASYLERVRELPVLSQVEPGQIRAALPGSVPEDPEPALPVLTTVTGSAELAPLELAEGVELAGDSAAARAIPEVCASTWRCSLRLALAFSLAGVADPSSRVWAALVGAEVATGVVEVGSMVVCDGALMVLVFVRFAAVDAE